ncbi:MAG: hypothetical protein CMH57_16145 [Myxococcales bacterium]|nr:hypothetical protein [Myxococcales bacterium]
MNTARHRTALALCALWMGACGAAPKAPVPEVPEPAAAPASAPTSAPAQGAEAPTLAAQVHRAAGGERFEEVRVVSFTFAVEQGGERAFEARHTWDRRAGTDRVVWTDRASGVAYDVTLDVAAKTAQGTANGAPLPDPATVAKLAYARWINDTYWLLMPLKVLDPGVQQTDEGTREHDGASYRVLRLAFSGVGLTPGDVYDLLIDPETLQVAWWEMRLQGRADQPTLVSWEGHEAFGPLTLATRHVVAGGARQILLEEVVVQ